MPEDTLELDKFDAYRPTEDEQKAIHECLKTFEKARSTTNKSYNYFGGNNLVDVIDDWTKRWNGYTPPMSPLLDQTQSNIFFNFTRNAIISYLSKVAMSPVQAHIIAVNKKTGLVDQKFADVLEDLNQFSLNAENAPQKFLMAALECVTKGTVVVYEGYMKQKQKAKFPTEFDATTGKVKYKEEERIVFDNCYQEVVPLEDFFITNPFQPDVQKQPKIIWRKLTSESEAKAEFGHYKVWDYVRPGKYLVAQDMEPFYRNMLVTELGRDQVEVLRYYERIENRHIILANGVVLYDGPIPFKDGRYPFAKAINEPFGNDFFWGNGHPNKFMGEQDLVNTFLNAMADKTIASTVTTGLSSDLDDLIDDDVVEIGKWRKVGDIEKWKYLEAPDVSTGEFNMFQLVMNLARESGNTDAGNQTTPRGGKMQTRQVLMKQQELQQKLAYNMNFLEDLERDRTELRVSHILQFYSIGKIEKITGKDGKEVEKLAYRDTQLNDTRLTNGKKGNRIIKLVDGDTIKNPDDKKRLQDDMSVTEAMGELSGSPTEVLAMSVDSFHDFNNSIQVVKHSSYEKNQALDQAMRSEFVQLRVQLAELAPIKNPQGLIEWLEEAYDIDSDKFETAAPGQPPQMPPAQPGQPGSPSPGSMTRQLGSAGASAGNLIS